MRDPDKTTFNADFFKGMSFPAFKKYWEANGLGGEPTKHYTKWTGEKLPKKKSIAADGNTG